MGEGGEGLLRKIQEKRTAERSPGKCSDNPRQKDEGVAQFMQKISDYVAHPSFGIGGLGAAIPRPKLPSQIWTDCKG